MRQQLIGYLVDALDDAEREQVEAALREQPSLQQELQLLMISLDPLAVDREHHAAPPGLARRTCAFVSARVVASLAVPAAPASRSWRLQDLAVAAGIFIAASLLFFPAVSETRYLAQRAACAANLRQVGLALTQYSEAFGDHFPQIPQQGPLNVAGIYAPVLLETGYLDDAKWLVCPASALASRGNFSVPKRAQIQRAALDEQQRLVRELGGSYGFPLGYLADGVYHGVKNLRRANFALVADAPDAEQPEHCSPNHAACGQNVLFEDGRVDFLKTCTHEAAKDHIFANHQGKLAPGIGPDDAVIGPSHIVPAMLLGN